MKFYIFKQKHFQKMNEDTKKSKSGYFCFKCNKYLSEKRSQFKLHMESECKNKMFNLFGHVAKSILQEFVNNSDDNILSIFSKTLFNNKIDELNGNNNNDTDDNVITFDQQTDDDAKNDDLVTSSNIICEEDPNVTSSVVVAIDKKYRQIPKKVAEVIDEDTEDNKQKHINEIQKLLDNRRKECKSLDDALPIFQKCFEKLKECKIDSTNNKTLELLKNTRMDILKITPYDNYLKILNDHVSKLTKIFKDKEFTEKKINSNVLKGISGIESRLIFSHQYTTISLEYDHIESLSSCLDFSIVSPEEYTPFDYDSFFKKFHNYGSVIFSIKDLIPKYLFNQYGFNNFIYIPLSKSLDDDPYSYYKLSRFSDEGKRLWDMDCRAETLSNNFISDLRPYLTLIFRKIYYDIFHDNDYRPNFSNEAVIAETDCEQLIKNILLLGNPIECCNLFRRVIKEKASTAGQRLNDKWNIFADDEFQKKRFKKNKNNNPDILYIIKPLFDNISAEQAVDFYREKYTPTF